ncbi:MAG: CDP-diacylglycerol--glycerol-3-phosphate 3-phosphatidyltransferase [Eubacteriales bacterium]|nr:CDP-diacylglycerol--glycerol-3-phosphate 3-phosphatidyltransferase [Eubacteriales bacterium]
MSMKKNTANKITVFRMILVPVFLILAYTGKTMFAVAAFVVATASDFLDGYIARKYNQITVFGKFMDPLADKILVLSAMCYFIDIGCMPGWAVAIVLFREFAVSGLRLLAVQDHVVIAAAWSGKIKTGATMVAIIVMMTFRCQAHDIIGTAVIVLTTVYSGIEYFIKNRQVFSNS